MKSKVKSDTIVKWHSRTDCLFQEASGISSVTLSYLLSCFSYCPPCTLLVDPVVPHGTLHSQLCFNRTHLQTLLSYNVQTSHILRGDKWDSRGLVCLKLSKTLGQGKRRKLREQRTDCETTPMGIRQGGFMVQVEMLNSAAQK